MYQIIMNRFTSSNFHFPQIFDEARIEITDGGDGRNKMRTIALVHALPVVVVVVVDVVVVVVLQTLQTNFL